MTRSLDEAIAKVVGSGTCSGCGACCLLDPALSMALDGDGFLRPVRRGAAAPKGPDGHGVGDADDSAVVAPSAGSAVDPAARLGHVAGVDPVARFEDVCPGRIVSSPRPRGASRHPQLGSYLESWVVWATDPEIRHRGASGGALTALADWLTASGRAHRVVGAAAAPEPRRTVSVTITDRATALAAAGSRYAPVATLASPDVLDPSAAVVAKPCEAGALARMTAGLPEAERPLILSFFCAGTPSQHATDDLVRELGVEDPGAVTALRYRGCGWPGEFTVTTAEAEHRMDYRTSWGDRLGPAVQWRCKICPDGVGESADLAACDYWETDERGYPLFEEGDGRSGLLVRTERGREVLQAALDAGVLAGEPLAAEKIVAVQPGQTWRRENLWGRLVGARLGGRPTPRYRGFPLRRLALEDLRRTVRAIRGSRRRALASAASSTDRRR